MAANQIAKRLVPLMDRVLVQKLKPITQTKTGIFLPDSAKGASNMAKVLAVGPGRFNQAGDRIPVNVKPGETVIVPEYGGMPLKLEEEEFHVFRDEDLIGTVCEP